MNPVPKRIISVGITQRKYTLITIMQRASHFNIKAQ